MNAPRIVVLMSVYNETPYLDETIPALLGQTMPDWRAVILDNGSTDDSWAMLERHHDARVTLIRSPENLRPGKVANFVAGLAMDVFRDCRWFVGQGADDVMHPDYLEALTTAALRNPAVNCIFSPWQYIGKPGVKFFPTFDPETAHAVHQIPAWHAFTRELRTAVGDYDETMTAADWDWVMRAVVSGWLHPLQLDRPYLSLRVRTDRKSQSDEVNWPSLHRHLCEIARKPVPTWAR